jgi:hypothetical protein
VLPPLSDGQKKVTKYFQQDYAADFATVLERNEARLSSGLFEHYPHRLLDILEDDEDEGLPEEQAVNSTVKGLRGVE